jgi:hypothetical protein
MNEEPQRAMQEDHVMQDKCRHGLSVTRLRFLS